MSMAQTMSLWSCSGSSGEADDSTFRSGEADDSTFRSGVNREDTSALSPAQLTRLLILDLRDYLFSTYLDLPHGSLTAMG
jgi:hypothetical protein